MALCSEDRRLRPVIVDNSECGRFDFTVTFEEAVLSIAPCVVVLLIVPLRLNALWRADKLVRWPVGEWSKLVRHE
jgi:hypothetical protein